MKKKQMQAIVATFLLGIMILSLQAEEVCKFASTQSPELLNAKVIKVPSNSVAMDNMVYVKDFFSELTKGSASSVFFVIDNSSSMTTQPGTDRWGSRFTVARALLDTFFNKNPDIEVGFATFMNQHYFFKNDDAEIIDEYPAASQAGYLKLLKLNGQYQSTSNKKTGYEILKHYLQTDSSKENSMTTYMALKYRPSWAMLQPAQNQGTNITFGFEAAKQALQASKYAKENRFIIFFSDGEATQPKDDNATMMKFKAGTDVPTTFSIFFTGGDSVPSSIKEMTENIKKNNYSASNPLSNLWSIKTDFATLMGLLMKNVIPMIIKQTTSTTPQKIEVNGSINSSDWSNKNFKFEKLFPLIGKTTPFSYGINYKIVKDSILPNGQKIQVGIKDTALSIKFSAEIQSDNTIKDSIRVARWGRKINFFADNTEITMVSMDMKELEIRFSEYKVDTLYGYTDPTVTIKTTSGSLQDSETFALKKENDYYTVKFSRSISTPGPDNKTLEHNLKDTFIVTWKNKDLPLDTLRYTLPFFGVKIASLSKAIYFDRNADGHVDSIYIGFIGQVVEQDMEMILKKIQLPKWRAFKTIGQRFLTTGFGLSVLEEMSQINTAVTAEDKISLADTLTLSNQTLFLPGSVDVIDEVAPVIMKASVRDTIVIIKKGDKITDKKQPNFGLLSVNFSESVETISQKKPFRLCVPGSMDFYSATVDRLNQNNDAVQFTVTDLTNSAKKINDGDSIWIAWDLPSVNIADKPGNDQKNMDNIKRPIAVETHYDTVETPAFYRLVFKATLLDYNKGTAIPPSVLSLKQVSKNLSLAQKDGEGRYKAMLMALEPDQVDSVIVGKDSFTAEFDLYDPVGNIVLKKQKMEFDPKRKSLYYAWNGYTNSDRFAGPGTYAVIVRVEYFFKEKFLRKEVIKPKPLVGIKK
ncbi:MAG: VWA domain-containing protein [Chitinivibrionales bacterium]|nr:VWA domain-containing protein [Chitinivibrionales bacterium]